MPHAKPKFGGGLAVGVDVWHKIAWQMILWMKKSSYYAEWQIGQGAPAILPILTKREISHMNSVYNELCLK